NLFGMTRTCQPGVFGAVPGRRTATISGGVLSSCPSQNGQKDPSGGDSCVGTKSMGRRLRSVAMMTQVLEIGSCLSSDIDSLRKNQHQIAPGHDRPGDRTRQPVLGCPRLSPPSTGVLYRP